MVKEKLMVLNKVEKTKEQNQFDKLNAKLDMLIKYQELMLKQIDDKQFEVVKDAPASGDYTDPILFVPPMNVEVGKWYYTEAVGKDLPREAMLTSKNVNSFDDKLVFDWV